MVGLEFTHLFTCTRGTLWQGRLHHTGYVFFRDSVKLLSLILKSIYNMTY
jgi:hypothetical protein